MYQLPPEIGGMWKVAIWSPALTLVSLAEEVRV